MSDVATKPVEETPATTAAPVETTTAPESKVEETPAAEPVSEVAPTTEATESAPAATEETPVPATEETVKEGESKIEATPASEGVLGFKHPPFPNTLRFAKRFFWFSDEPVKAEHLSSYLRETKADVAHPTAAWAQETGKGLLFYAKRAEDKSAPAGIIHLADVTDVTKEGHKEFSFKVNGHKNIFQTDSTEQQASWIVALETKVAEAKDLKEGVTGSEGYKSSLEKYAKPASLFAPGAAAAAAGTKSTSPAPKKSLDTKDVISSDEDKKDKAKSRSVSRKRNSIFGSLLAKKDEVQEKKEVKKEEKAEQKEEKKEEKKEAKEGEPSTAAEAATGAAVAAPVAVAAEEEKREEKADETPAHTAATEAPEASTSERPVLDGKKKRSSVFGSFFNKVTSPSAEKSEKEIVPEVPAKDNTTEPVAETAPQVDAPVEAEPIDTAAVTAPVDGAAETPAAETKPETKEAVPSKESKGLKGFFKKAEAKVEGKKEAKEEKKEIKEEEKAEKKAEETPAVASTETPAATEAAPATTEAAPAEAAPKENRRKSIFGTLSGTIKKKTGGKKTPAEEKKEFTDSTPAAAEEPTEAKPEPISKDEPTEPATNGVSAQEPIKEAEPFVDSTATQGLESTPALKASA